jgi:transcriptional regulator with XRE-family HTH domain/tetratricopeptide (TPR) repeat protein
MTPTPTFGEHLRRLRQAADLTLESLAERSGVSVRTIGDIERGVSVAPQRRTVDALARGLRLAPSERDALLREARARRAVPSEGQRASAVAPHRVWDFSGRTREIAEITSFLTPSDSALAAPVVIAGLAGIGKTTTALEAIHRLRGDRGPLLFLDLDGMSSRPLTPGEVVIGLLRQLPGIGEEVAATLDEAVVLWREATARRPLTVLLDNAASERQIRPVLGVHPGVTIVITARRALAGLEGVRRITLGPLPADESVELLAKIIPAEQRAAGDLRELATLSSHIPLAMRIAGNRIAGSPAVQAGDFADRIRSTENRLRVLVAGDLAVEAAFALSYQELDPPTAELFRSISVIDAGTFDARIASATLPSGVPENEVESRLDELTDLGLVEARGGNRYHLHDLVRVFAATRLISQEGADAAKMPSERLRGWLLSTLERAGAWFEPARSAHPQGRVGIRFADKEAAEAWIRIEEQHWWPALRAAAAAGHHALVVDVADALHWFSELWMSWGHWSELFGLAVESARALDDSRFEAMHLGYQVWAIVVERRDFVEGLRLARLAVAAADRSGDAQQKGWAHYYLSWMLKRSNVEEALAAGRIAVLQLGLAGDYEGSVNATIQVASLIDLTGDHEFALLQYRMALEQVQEHAATAPNLALTIIELDLERRISRLLVTLGRSVEAVEAADRAVTLGEALGSETFLGVALRDRAFARLAAAHIDEARGDIERALEGLDAASPSGSGTAIRAELLVLLEAAGDRSA